MLTNIMQPGRYGTQTCYRKGLFTFQEVQNDDDDAKIGIGCKAEKNNLPQIASSGPRCAWTCFISALCCSRFYLATVWSIMCILRDMGCISFSYANYFLHRLQIRDQCSSTMESEFHQDQWTWPWYDSAILSLVTNHSEHSTPAAQTILCPCAWSQVG